MKCLVIQNKEIVYDLIPELKILLVLYYHFIRSGRKGCFYE